MVGKELRENLLKKECNVCFTGAVTYRVVQVATQDVADQQGQVVTTTGFPAGAQVVFSTLYQTISDFNNPGKETFLEHCGKRRKCL